MTRVDPVERVLNLFSLLHESPAALTRAEIASRMAEGLTPYPDDEEAQRQQFHTDKRTITAALGVAVHQRPRGGDQAGQVEYWLDPADLALPDLQLDDEERLVLSIALAAISRSVPDAGEALLRLEPSSTGDSPFELSVDVPDIVLAMIDVARNGGVVKLTVTGGQFLFEPWVVMLDRAAWVTVGHDVASGGPRAVRLDRLLADPEPQERSRSVVRPELDSERLQALVRTGPGVSPLQATVMVDEVTAARAALSPQVRHRSQVNLFGRVELRVEVADAARFRSWLLALGERAELVSPPALREEIVAWLEAVVDSEPSGVAAPQRPRRPAKRPGPEPAAERLHRLLSIVPWLYEQGSARIDEIAERVGVGPAQVLHDLTLASMCGVPPYSPGDLFGLLVDPDAGTVEVIQPTLVKGPVRLTARQAMAVGLALSAVEALPGRWRDVAERLRDELAAAVGDVPVRVRLDEPPFLDDVRTAVAGHERIRIEYVDLGDNVTERPIDPHRLFNDRGSWYLIADDHLRDDQRVFRVDRLLSVAPTGEHFDRRKVAIPAGKQWKWMVQTEDVVVRLPPGSEWVLDRYAVDASVAGDDGWLTVWLSVVSEHWLAALLLRCGRGAEVLSPARFADLASRSARAALARYR